MTAINPFTVDSVPYDILNDLINSSSFLQLPTIFCQEYQIIFANFSFLFIYDFLTYPVSLSLFGLIPFWHLSCPIQCRWKIWHSKNRDGFSIAKENQYTVHLIYLEKYIYEANFLMIYLITCSIYCGCRQKVIKTTSLSYFEMKQK